MTIRLLGIRIHAGPGFLLLAALFAAAERSVLGVALACAAITLAVLVHELGHALLAKLFGRTPTIVFHMLGGTTLLEGDPLPRPQSLAVTLGGPTAGAFLSMGAFSLLQREDLAPWATELVRRVFLTSSLLTVVNLLPILPFDGGLVLRDALGPTRGRATYLISAATGAAFAALCFRSAPAFPALLGLGAVFVVATVTAVRRAVAFDADKEAAAARDEAVLAVMGSAEELETQGMTREANRRATAVLAVSAEAGTRDRARRLLARSALAAGDGPKALTHLGTIEQASDTDHVLQAEALDLLGRRDDAFELLTSRATMDPRGPALLPLLRGLVATEQLDRAVALLIDLAENASQEAVVYLLGVTETRGDHAASLAVIRALGRRSGEMQDDATVARLAAEVSASPRG